MSEMRKADAEEPAAQPGGTSAERTREVARITALWQAKYIPADSGTEITARAFAKEFTVGELRGLLEFYRSPLGRRLIDAKPRIARSTETEVKALLMKHGDELRSMLQRVP